VPAEFLKKRAVMQTTKQLSADPLRRHSVCELVMYCKEREQKSVDEVLRDERFDKHLIRSVLFCLF